MTSNSLLKYCLFYKGEVICPPKYDGKNAGKLWKAEQFVCEELYNLVDNQNRIKVLFNTFPTMCKNGRRLGSKK